MSASDHRISRHEKNFATQLKQNYPHIPILVFSVHPESHYALRAIKSGASGYLCKNCSSAQLIEAIQTVHQKKCYISPVVAQLLTHILHSDSVGQNRHELLSDREFQVLLLIAQGVPLTEMARKFIISVKTVSTYRLRILEKMQMTTNAELIQYVVKNELLPQARIDL